MSQIATPNYHKKIYIAYTGGTIGMMASEQGFIPKSNFLSEYIYNLPELNRSELPNYQLHEYDILLDSANITPHDWMSIAHDIANKYDDYDGFIILHGTDTMAYTASALSFALDNLAKPVIITGSQIPINAIRSDGLQNLLNSLYLSAYHPINEVALFFNNKLYRGNRCKKSHSDGFNAFSSPNFPSLIDAGIHIEVKENLLLPKPTNPFKLNNIVEQPIGIVFLYPGIQASVIRNTLKQPVNALILLSFGVGNAPDNKEIHNLLEQAIAQGIIIVNLTQCHAGSIYMKGYKTGNELERIGVISGYDLTVEAALAKLHYLLSQEYSNEKIKQLFQQDLKGEITNKG